MKKVLALGAPALAGTFVTSLAASAQTMLTAKSGMTVYTFDKDTEGKPTCYAACSKMWPPYLAKRGEKMGEGWATVKRTNGSLAMDTWRQAALPLFGGQEEGRHDRRWRRRCLAYRQRIAM